MAIRIKVQKDYLMTEASIDLPVCVSEVDELLKAIKTTGKMVVQYNRGSIQGINVEQRATVPEQTATEIRGLLDINTKIL
jgi:hypothetical protein